MNARRLTTTGLLLALISAIGTANGQEEVPRRGERRLVERFLRVDLEQLTEQLSLSAEQVDEMRETLDHANRELVELRRAERQGESAREIQEQLNRLLQGLREELLAALTEEQHRELETLHKRLGKRQQANWKRLDPHELAERLQLDDEQLAAVKRALRGIDLDVKALRDAYKDDRPRFRREIRMLQEEIRAELEQILSAEQMEGLRELRQGERGSRKKPKRRRFFSPTGAE